MTRARSRVILQRDGASLLAGVSAMMPAMTIRRLILLAALVLPVLAAAPTVASLRDAIGNAETRVWSAPFPLPVGRSISELVLGERLARLGYTRVRHRPEAVGEYFWGREVFWIYRRGYRHEGQRRAPRLIGLALEPSSGRILGRRGQDGATEPYTPKRAPQLEPELLAESLDARRAPRRWVELDALPEHFWRAVLATEDARFFEHPGLDGRSLARAMLRNAKSGRVVQGGSTITQQLVKNRDLSPKRSLSRKVSEAVRALALEAEYDKRAILEAYLNVIYWGEAEGGAVYGIDAAARAHFDKRPERLTLPESALLAGMIQAPNRLHPGRHPEAAKKRRGWVLGRLAELGWADEAAIERAQRAPLGHRPGSLARTPARHFLGWIAESVGERHDGRLERGRGVVVESTLDPWLQRRAEKAVERELSGLRRRHRRLRRAPLSAALLALDLESGAVLAYVGGDPAAKGDAFDRVRQARRQPGSTIKPFLLIEAFEGCRLHPAARVADKALTWQLPSGPWSPSNIDGRYRGAMDIRRALRESRNVPFVRLVRHCGIEESAEPLREAGLSIPTPAPPSFSLGALETSPLELAAGFSAFARGGRTAVAHGIARLEKPSGARLRRGSRHGVRVAKRRTAYLIHHLLMDAMRNGTGRGAALDDVAAAGKTGTSSRLRDAWFVGYADSVLTVVWVGLDDGKPLGLGGASAAAPLWRRFMADAVPSRAPRAIEEPPGLVHRHVDPETGLIVSEHKGRPELFPRGSLPRRDRWWRRDPDEPVIR